MRRFKTWWGSIVRAFKQGAAEESPELVRKGWAK